jgi:hypothetical protein
MTDSEILSSIRTWAAAQIGKDKVGAITDILSTIAQQIDENMLLMPLQEKMVTETLDSLVFAIEPEKDLQV